MAANRASFSEAVAQYFRAESTESVLFIVLGSAALFASGILWRTQRPLLRGMAGPLLLIGAIEFGVGLSIFLRTPSDLGRVHRFEQHAPEKLRTEEIPRMRIVMKNFVTYRWIEVALVTAGLALWITSARRPGLRGVGAGLFLQAGLLLGLDYVAERRAAVYVQELENRASEKGESK